MSKKTIVFSEVGEELIIKINSSNKPIIRVVSFIVGVLITYFSLHISWLLLPDSNYGLIILFPLCLLLFLVGFNYLKKTFHEEIVRVIDNQLIISNSYWFFANKKKFQVNDIVDIRYLGHSNSSAHLLEGKSVDYMGFGTKEKEIYNFNHDGTIGVFSNGRRTRFGKNVTSWDAEELISRIEEKMGKQFPRNTTIGVNGVNEKE